MSYSRGRFGVEYDPTRHDHEESHLLRWTLFGVAAVAAVSFVSVRGCSQKVKLPELSPPTVVAPAPQPPPTTPELPPPPRHRSGVQPTTPTAVHDTTPVHDPTNATANPTAVQLVERWLASSAERPAKERTLLEKLLAAERAANAALALDTIERLRSSPAMADLDEPLARRLGTLNLQRLFSGRPTPWTVTVTTKRGDSPYRIAREHGTTLAAVLRLNGIQPDTRLDAGTVLCVLEFPRAALVIHRQTKFADLTMNGKFFKRYYASTGAATKTGSFQVTREIGPRMRLKELAVVFVPDDLEEIAMLLPPGASIVVTAH